jgi:4-amino-4-deoxy-L-arabinose transferase-like glycosyltransferase
MISFMPEVVDRLAASIPEASLEHTHAGARELRATHWIRRLDRAALTLGGVLVLALALRLWGIRTGLPFSYNEDEERHFVPVAVGFLNDGLNPHYFLNPPGFSELLAVVYAVWFGGGGGAARAFARDPGEALLVARVTVALLGTAAVWLTYLAGARLFERRVGLLAAALGAVAFLPIAYAHLALNDVPAYAAATLALAAAALVLRGGGGARAVAVGGVAAGLAAGTKYTAGIALAPLVFAILMRGGARRRADGRLGPVAPRRVGLALTAALGGFLLANPYALLDFGAFHAGVSQQRTLTSGDELEKLGLTQRNGIVYYLWTLTWGIGWIPALAALGGAVRLLVRDRRLAWVLLPAPLLYIVFMGSQERYFGRWLLPVVPIALLLAASFGVAVARALARRAPAAATPALLLVAGALLAQGLVTALHLDRVSARADTRGIARAWLLAHVPAGERIVVEPIVPVAWGAPWTLWDATRADVDDQARRLPHGRTRFVKTDRYERTLRPQLIDEYVRARYCWVAIGSTQYQRALIEPDEAPQAVAYYDALARRGRVVLRVAPVAPGSRLPAFNFDWSFDAYPLADQRTGPELIVYRLRGCRPARG